VPRTRAAIDEGAQVAKSANGTRVIGGVCYYLNGTVSAYTPEELETKKVAERAYRKSKGQKAIFVKVCSIECKVYTTLEASA
jgi:hypothetical protein